eukprot:3520534-Prymnesium_polylepis.1
MPAINCTTSSVRHGVHVPACAGLYAACQSPLSSVTVNADVCVCDTRRYGHVRPTTCVKNADLMANLVVGCLLLVASAQGACLPRSGRRRVASPDRSVRSQG